MQHAEGRNNIDLFILSAAKESIVWKEWRLFVVLEKLAWQMACIVWRRKWAICIVMAGGCKSTIEVELSMTYNRPIGNDMLNLMTPPIEATHRQVRQYNQHAGSPSLLRVLLVYKIPPRHIRRRPLSVQWVPSQHHHSPTGHPKSAA